MNFIFSNAPLHLVVRVLLTTTTTLAITGAGDLAGNVTGGGGIAGSGNTIFIGSYSDDIVVTGVAIFGGDGGNTINVSNNKIYMGYKDEKTESQYKVTGDLGRPKSHVIGGLITKGDASNNEVYLSSITAVARVVGGVTTAGNSKNKKVIVDGATVSQMVSGGGNCSGTNCVTTAFSVSGLIMPFFEVFRGWFLRQVNIIERGSPGRECPSEPGPP